MGLCNEKAGKNGPLFPLAQQISLKSDRLLGREKHHPGWKARFQEAPPAPDNPTPLQAMAHRLTTLAWNVRRMFAMLPA